MVNERPVTEIGGGMWRPLAGPFSPGDLEMSVVDLFDWTRTGYIDLRYYLVLIEDFPAHPEFSQHHALVDVGYPRVLWEPPEECERVTDPSA
jgi:hypothetical protein